MPKKTAPAPNVLNFFAPGTQRHLVSLPPFNAQTANEDIATLSEDTLRDKLGLLVTLLTMEIEKTVDVDMFTVSLPVELRDYLAIALQHIGEEQAAQFIRQDQFALAMTMFAMGRMLDEFEPESLTMPAPRKPPSKKNTKQQKGKFFQIKIDLVNAHPAVWRRVVVPGSFTFAQLHCVIQKAMGWTDSHLHAFEWNRMRIGTSQEPMDNEIDESTVTLLEMGLRKKSKLLYTYDFGDDWSHELTVEEVGNDPAINRATCTDGAGACPPEDCGGVWRYSQLAGGAQQNLFASDEEKEEIEWFQQQIAANAFDCNTANALVTKVR